MLNAGVASFDKDGRVRYTNELPGKGSINAGVPFNGELVSATPGIPRTWVNGLPFTAAGRLSIQFGRPVVRYSHSGLPLTDLGSVAVDTTSPISFYSSGLPFTIDGKLALAGVESPVEVSAFSSGFDQGFA